MSKIIDTDPGELGECTHCGQVVPLDDLVRRREASPTAIDVARLRWQLAEVGGLLAVMQRRYETAQMQLLDARRELVRLGASCAQCGQLFDLHDSDGGACCSRCADPEVVEAFMAPSCDCGKCDA